MRRTRRALHALPLALLLAAALLPGGSGCGKREPKVDPLPRKAVMERGMARVQRNVAHLAGAAPGFTENSLGEKDRYIVTKACLIKYCQEGGKMQAFLKGLGIEPADWKFLDDFYWLDPTVRAEVMKELQPPAAD